MRLFYALPFGQKTRHDMEALQSQLLPQLERGRPTQWENLHLTLAFLGDVAPSHVPALRGIRKELQQTPVFSLCFDRIGTFGGKQPVLYLAPQSSPILFALEQRLRTALEQQGFFLESRPFIPHVTLIRNARTYANLSFSAPSFPAIHAEITSVSLMLSDRQEGRLVYTPLASIFFSD